ncbi:hypothetical protein [Nostoc sp. PCC 7107]|uniref:hypothetical protein n=1 Tax=Nostoc sp. PCC 7107 TaxID=317936 RepID=UPI00155A2D94|nr:hypothetical protein [Nostoc sp. PCC 7107]
MTKNVHFLNCTNAIVQSDRYNLRVDNTLYGAANAQAVNSMAQKPLPEFVWEKIDS